MCVGTGTAIALAVSAGAQAGAGIYAAHKQAGSAHEAVTAQTAAADKAAELQSKSAADALAYTKEQEARARLDAETTQHANYDQWRAAQVYQNAGSAARARNINALGARYGVAARDIPEMAIPAYRGLDVGAAGSGAGTPGTPAPGALALPPGIRIDPETLTQQITASFQQMAGRDPTAAELSAGIHYASKPDVYSDGKTRIGWNDYLATRLVTGSASADPRLAGEAGVIPGGVPGLATSTVGAAMRGPAAPTALPVTASGGSTPPINPALTVDPYQRRTVRDYFAA